MSKRKLVKLAIVIGLIAAWTLDLLPARLAAAQTPFLASPYFGTTTISQGYSSSHKAYDFSLTIGNRILAAESGTVTVAGWQDSQWSQSDGCHEYRLFPGHPDFDQSMASKCGCGLYVQIAHSGGYQTTYCHLSAVAVQVGQGVAKGQMIGTSGNNGWSSGPHLHFAVKQNLNSVDPFNPNLWSHGQWAGYPLAAPVNYGTLVSIDDTPDNTGGFMKGRSWGSPVECPPNNCPYWYRVTGIGVGSDMYYTYVNGTSADYWAEWRPNLSQEGLYEVQVHIPCNHATSWYARYNIFSSGYHDAWVRVDQLGLCNQRISLGYYHLRSGSYALVRALDATDEPYSTLRKVGVDEIRFQPVNVGPLEVEDYRERIGRTYDGLYMNWEFRNWSDKPGWRGSGAMQALPKDPHKNINSGYTTASPELRYRVVLPAAGTYYVWVRGYGENGNEDSIHSGYDNLFISSADRISGCGWNSPGWKWCNATLDGSRATISPGAGLHTFNLWMRENGFRADQVLLTQDASYTPP